MAARGGRSRPGCWPQPFRHCGAALHCGPVSAEALDRRQQCCPFRQQLNAQSEPAAGRGMPHRNGPSSANVTSAAARARPARAARCAIELAGARLTGFRRYGRRRISMDPFCSQAASTPPSGKAQREGKVPASESTSTLPSFQASTLGPFSQTAYGWPPLSASATSLPAPRRCSGLPGSSRKMSLSRRHAVTMRPFDTARPPPSMGQALSFQVPVPSLAAVGKVAPSAEIERYISREPSIELRHMTSTRPAASIATEGWQHSQMLPPGER